MNQLEEIRKKVIEANPEVGELKGYECGSCGADDELFYRPIRLADVLLAIGSKYAVATDGGFLKLGYENGWDVEEYAECWNLRSDDLSLQSKETIDFIHQLLCQ